MNSSWWKESGDLDQKQGDFVTLQAEGKYKLFGPPGSGKTNLLLLRGNFLYGSGFKNILFLTLSKSLANFIKTGVSGNRFLQYDQIVTFRRWALNHIRDYAGDRISEIPRDKSYGDTQPQIIELLKEANSKRNVEKLYDAIIIDEIQDLHEEELSILDQLSDNISVAGDGRQKIYKTNALNNPCLQNYKETKLIFHYRLGGKICEVADKLLPDDPLTPHCQYNETKYGSSAELIELSSRQQQIEKILATIDTQKKAYPDELIGIITPRTSGLNELKDHLDRIGRSDVAFHHVDSEDHTFASDKIIHALTIHSAKGTEFRAVHIFAAEDFKFPLNSRELMYTAMTRAKTSLNVYHTGRILHPLESAFSTRAIVGLDQVF